MKVRIAQSDCVTAYGRGIEALWNGLLSGKTAIGATDRFSERAFCSEQAALISELPEKSGESRVWGAMKMILPALAGQIDPDTPLILATTVGEIEFVERSVLESNAAIAAESRPEVLLERIQRFLGLRGPAWVVSSACASSTAALTCAAAMIRHGKATQVLVVAADGVSEFVYSGFSTLASLDSEPARPFNTNRRGLSLGEAAAWAILREDSADEVAPCILGWGNTSDAVHMTAPDREANGLLRAIQKSMAMAKCNATDIAMIAAHGTGTVYSDAMEMLAFRRAFGTPQPVFSIKGAIGHTLGAAGLVQILVACKALESGVVPPSVGIMTPDENAVNWVGGECKSIGKNRLALSTNSGFGGVNTAIVLGAS